MFKRSAPFLLGLALVALSGTPAAADRPIRELIDPLYLSGDPYEPERAYNGHGPNLDGTSLLDSGVRTGSKSRTHSTPEIRRSGTTPISRLFISLRSMAWLIWLMG